MDAIDTGAPISVPVGERTKGRIFNLLGTPLDTVARGDLETGTEWPIHREAPKFDEQEAVSEIFETGIKVVDLLCPFAKGGKIGLFGSGRRQDGPHPGAHPDHRGREGRLQRVRRRRRAHA